MSEELLKAHFFNPEHELEQKVTMITNQNMLGLIDGYVVDKHGVLYRVAWSDGSNKTHYSFELTKWEPQRAVTLGDIRIGDLM